MAKRIAGGTSSTFTSISIGISIAIVGGIIIVVIIVITITIIIIIINNNTNTTLFNIHVTMYYSYTVDTPRCSVTIHHFKVQSLFVSLQVASVLIMEHNLEHLTLLVEFVHDPPKRDTNIKIALISSSPKTRPECSTPKLRSPNMVPLWIGFKTTNLWHFYSKKPSRMGFTENFPTKYGDFQTSNSENRDYTSKLPFLPVTPTVVAWYPSRNQIHQVCLHPSLCHPHWLHFPMFLLENPP